MLNPERIPGCKDTSFNVARRELVIQNPPSETIEDRQFHANNLQFIDWRGQKIGEITQVLDPGLKESEKSVVAYLADDIPGVDVELSNVTFTVVGKNLDAESTGVEEDIGAYSSKTYDAIPQDQGNKVFVRSCKFDITQFNVHSWDHDNWVRCTLEFLLGLTSIYIPLWMDTPVP